MSVAETYVLAICAGCDEPISQADDNAGAYEMRLDRQHHRECAARYDEALRALFPAHRVINARSQACDWCGKFLYDCACPVGVKCDLCGTDIEDVIADDSCCGAAPEWRDDEGNRVYPPTDSAPPSPRDELEAASVALAHAEAEAAAGIVCVNCGVSKEHFERTAEPCITDWAGDYPFASPIYGTHVFTGAPS